MSFPYGYQSGIARLKRKANAASDSKTAYQTGKAYNSPQQDEPITKEPESTNA